jgi:TonB family protein
VAAAGAAAAPPEIMIPEPVPDELAVTTTIMTQDQINAALAPITAQDLGGTLGKDLRIEGLPKSSDAQYGARVGTVDELPVRLSMNQPVYPEMARLAEVEGTVTLHILVGKDGRVKQVRFVDGPAMLKEAAIAAAKSAIFRPAAIDKRPVEVWVGIPIEFHIQG